MATYRVDVQPEVLIWARESIGLSVDQAAKKLGVSSLTLQYWEAGADQITRPTLVQLRDMANLYKRPLAALYLPQPPDSPEDELVDFRTLPSGGSRAWSLKLHENYRRVRMQREVAIELADEIDETPARFSISLSSDQKPEKAGQQIRAWLGISLQDQLSWKSEYKALWAWIGAVERRGILVAQAQGISLQEMRGYSISDQPFPVIVLNGSDAVRARIFTLLHELVHILQHSGGLCDLAPGRRRINEKESIESYCNEVAAAVLLPFAAMMEELEARGVVGQIPWSDESLAWLANKYKVSREVVLRRMVSLDRATLDYFFKKAIQYARQYEAQRLRDKESQRGGGGGPSLLLRDLGVRYTSDVLRAYDRRSINAAEMSEYLGVKVERVPTLTALLERGT